MNLKKFIKIKLLASILINYNSFCMENSYSDIQSMLLDIKPFEHEIDYGFLNVEYTNQRVSNITWFDEDSIKFTKIFHYDNDDLILIRKMIREINSRPITLNQILTLLSRMPELIKINDSHNSTDAYQISLKDDEKFLKND